MTQLTDNQYQELYGLIIETLYPISARILPTYMDRLGLPPTDADAFTSKRTYADLRLMRISDSDLFNIAQQIKRDYPTLELENFFQKYKTIQTITEITRKAIFDAIQLENIYYYGNCTELDFLKRVFNLNKISSNDHRFKTFESDLIQHTVNNSDWDEYWIFSDRRFNLLYADDNIFISFLCEMLHPIVRPNLADVVFLLNLFNQNLQNDGWEIYEYEKKSGKPIFKARKIGLTTKIKEIPFGEEYIKNQIKRMEDNIEKAPDLAIGTAKELVETTLITITNSTGKKMDFPELQKKALNSLNLVPECIPEAAKGSDIIKILLRNFSGIVQKMNELRNLYGTGHGKHAKVKGLEPRHARLAVGAAITFVNFVFETYQKQNKQ